MTLWHPRWRSYADLAPDLSDGSPLKQAAQRSPALRRKHYFVHEGDVASVGEGTTTRRITLSCSATSRVTNWIFGVAWKAM